MHLKWFTVKLRYIHLYLKCKIRNVLSRLFFLYILPFVTYIKHCVFMYLNATSKYVDLPFTL